MPKFRKFIIYAPDYSEDNGGAIVLHKFCHLLNTAGYEAHLYPSFKIWLMHREFWLKPLISTILSTIKYKYLRKYKTNPTFKTPIFKKRSRNISKDTVVIYAEGVIGNPLQGKNIVRWFLHQPGYHTGIIGFGKGELYFDFQSFSHNFQLPFSKLSNTKLYFNHYPVDKYNMTGALEDNLRKGTAHCIRKGSKKPLIHHPPDSILIDGMSHDQIAHIFKKVKTFISYDSKTAYSVFAGLCGADSVVIPDEGVSIEEWAPDEREVYGIAYGLPNIEWARSTRKNMIETINMNNEKNLSRVNLFVQEVNSYFK